MQIGQVFHRALQPVDLDHNQCITETSLCHYRNQDITVCTNSNRCYYLHGTEWWGGGVDTAIYNISSGSIEREEGANRYRNLPYSIDLPLSRGEHVFTFPYPSR